MKKKSTNKASITTDQAINDVLKAERDAQQQVAQCVADTERILEQARQTARRIGERNNNRIARIHQRCSRKISDEITRMQHVSKQLKEDEQEDRFDIVAMSDVLDQIAVALTTTQLDATKITSTR